MTSFSILRDIRFLGSKTRLWTSSHSLDQIMIFLHGSGITSFGMEKWLRSAAPQGPPPKIGVILPSAPMRKYLLDGGELRSVWHQRRDIDINSYFEDIQGIDEMCLGLKDLVTDVKNAGVSHITLGGFSMGGHLALHSVYREELHVSKCFALSSFVIHKSALYKNNYTSTNSKVPLYLAHGDSDSIVPQIWAQSCAEKMKNKNVETTLRIYRDIGHEIRSDIISDLFTWTKRK